MHYSSAAIDESKIPGASDPLFQHVLDTYASETNKLVSTWKLFGGDDLTYRPGEKSRTVLEILKHQLLSERRFFAEFIGTDEPPADAILPAEPSIAAYCERTTELVVSRLDSLAKQTATWWLQECPFFDTVRQRIWIFWRRVLHTAHHRTQLTVYLRLLGRAVPATYGPSADVTWSGADPTNTIEAAGPR